MQRNWLICWRRSCDDVADSDHVAAAVRGQIGGRVANAGPPLLRGFHFTPEEFAAQLHCSRNAEEMSYKHFRVLTDESLRHIHRRDNILPAAKIDRCYVDRNTAPAGASIEILALRPLRPMNRTVIRTPSTSTTLDSPS